MTHEQKLLVQTSFARVAPVAEQAAQLFYQRLFELDPTLRPMFKGDLTDQGRKLMQMLAVAVAGLDRLSELLPAVQSLGARHTEYGVQARDYDTVGAALVWTLRQALQEEFTPQMEAAWCAIYALLDEAMQGAKLAAEESSVIVRSAALG